MSRPAFARALGLFAVAVGLCLAGCANVKQVAPEPVDTLWRDAAFAPPAQALRVEDVFAEPEI